MARTERNRGSLFWRSFRPAGEGVRQKLFITSSVKRRVADICFASSYSFPIGRVLLSRLVQWLRRKRNGTISGGNNDISAHSEHGFNRGACQILGHPWPDGFSGWTARSPHTGFFTPKGRQSRSDANSEGSARPPAASWGGRYYVSETGAPVGPRETAYILSQKAEKAVAAVGAQNAPRLSANWAAGPTAAASISTRAISRFFLSRSSIPRICSSNQPHCLHKRLFIQIQHFDECRPASEREAITP